jgi:heterodisulfide reductase subunit B2
MDYLYYPGCSLKSNGRSYEESLLAIFRQLGVSMQEVIDWNCCGATSYMAIDDRCATALAARNLALAEQQGGKSVQLIAPCAACYMVLTKAQHNIHHNPELGAHVIDGLHTAGLEYSGTAKVRHPLDILMNEVGLDRIKAAVMKPLKGLKVVSYYGCQVVRPFITFDDPRDPLSMDNLVTALGATAVDWPLKTRCCGGALTNTIPEVGLRLNYHILTEARRRHADIMLTACPLCQFNLECYRRDMTKRYGNGLDIPVVYFTQLMGMAFGIPEHQLGVQRNFIPPACVRRVIGGELTHA